MRRPGSPEALADPAPACVAEDPAHAERLRRAALRAGAAVADRPPAPGSAERLVHLAAAAAGPPRGRTTGGDRPPACPPIAIVGALDAPR